MMENKLLAIMGSPGSGKTTTAIKLAQALAVLKKNVVLVFCEPFAPVIPAVIDVKNNHNVSLGALFTAPSLTQKQILDACVPIQESAYISLLGYREEENLMHYPKITKERVIDCLVSLRYLADYIILDCTTVFEADPASIAAMGKADALLYMATANSKGISYFQSHASMLSEFSAAGENRRMVIGNVKAGQDWEAAGALYGESRYVLPFTPELERQENEMALFSGFLCPGSRPYQLVINQILQDVFALQTEKEPAGKRIQERIQDAGSNQELKQPAKKGKGAKEKRAFIIPSLRRRGEF